MEFFILTQEQLQVEIQNGLKTQLEEFAKNFQPKEPNQFMSRQNVADMFQVNLSTIHNWCKKGKLNPLGVGARVYFLRSEVEQCLTPLNF